ncbi:DUF2848 domain-containing protein [Cryobacterium levicorallinum]|uniref:DUF2848 domain-containing protein n=1 Tax=Cryobacterium levicorallinum TaxID=995038 RepID=A0A4R8VLS6_9MICO|nr:DUF2848 domain-containing protein [Cryobacterium levicorallinum]
MRSNLGNRVCLGRAGSGGVEPVLPRASAEWLLTVGSDRTDKAIERESIPHLRERPGEPCLSSAIRLQSERRSLNPLVDLRFFTAR